MLVHAGCPQVIWGTVTLCTYFSEFSHLVGSCGLTFLPLICTHELFQAKPAFVLILVWFLNIFSV